METDKRKEALSRFRRRVAPPARLAPRELDLRTGLGRCFLCRLIVITLYRRVQDLRFRPGQKGLSQSHISMSTDMAEL